MDGTLEGEPRTWGPPLRGTGRTTDALTRLAVAHRKSLEGCRVIAVTGAKGGVGASTIAHNVAFAIARDLALDTVIADLDLPFGTAGLDFNQDPPQGVADAVFSPDRVDSAFIDRLLSKCTDRLSLLAAPATLEREYDFTTDTFDPVVDAMRSTVPFIVLDIPHLWSGWSKQNLIAADEVLLVAAPDLANLRNAKNLFDFIRAARPNDRPPLYVLNMMGVPKRPEVRVADFAKAQVLLGRIGHFVCGTKHGSTEYHQMHFHSCSVSKRHPLCLPPLPLSGRARRQQRASMVR